MTLRNASGMPSYVSRDRDERARSIETMKAAHLAICSGCYICATSRGMNRDDFAAPVDLRKTGALEDGTEYNPSAGGRRPLRPLPMSENPDGLEIAAEFLRTYEGSWSFMQTLKAEQSRGNLRYTPRVIEVILNCKAREEKWATERAATSAAIKTAPVVPQLPEGRRYYAVANESGELTFLRITKTKPTDRYPTPMTFVDQIVGGGLGADSNPQPRGRVTASGSYLGTFESLYRKVVADPEAAMAAFGHALGSCGYCGRTLTDVESRERGIGPVCARKAGF